MAITDSRRFLLVLRSSAGFYFGEDDSLPTMRFLTSTGPTEFSFGTMRTTPSGFTHPVRTGIWSDVRGEASTLHGAVDVWANWARGLAAILSFAANAPVGDLTAHFAYEITSGATKREYWSRSLPDIPFLPPIKRRLPSTLPMALITAWQQQPPDKQERWFRVFNAYHHALQEWEPGIEIPSVAHLWIGMEAITPIALDNYLQSTKFTREQLASNWNVEVRALDAEVRLRLLFKGDKDCYGAARDLRNEHQHAYGQLWKVREKAIEIKIKTAAYLREAIIRLLGIAPFVERALQEPPFDQPCHSGMTNNLFAILQMGDRPDAYDHTPYPHIEWASHSIQVGVDVEEDAEIGVEIAVLPLFNDGTKLEGLRIAIETDPTRPLVPSKVALVNWIPSSGSPIDPVGFNKSQFEKPVYRRRVIKSKSDITPSLRSRYRNDSVNLESGRSS